MSRVQQVNSVLQQQLADAVSHAVTLKGGLITIMRVDCSPDLREADVYVSVLPEKYSGTVLSDLRHKTGELARLVSKHVKLKRLPVLTWKLDTSAREAAELESIFDSIAS